MKYMITYKCSLCGTEIYCGEAPKNLSYDDLKNICAKVVTYQQLSSNPYLNIPSMQVIHNCPDCSCCGLAYFSGFKKIGKE